MDDITIAFWTVEGFRLSSDSPFIAFTFWLAILLIIGLMMAKWRLGLYGILDDAIDWIRRKMNR